MLFLGLIEVILSQQFWALSMEQCLGLGRDGAGRVVEGGVRAEKWVEKGLGGLGKGWLMS